MENIWEEVQETRDWLTGKGFDQPEIGVILGTGLGAFLEKIQVTVSVPYTDIPHFPVSTVEYHKGQLVFGEIHGVKVMVMQGRFHYYEGYSMQQITFPVRVMQALGIRHLLLSNVAGGINLSYRKGDLIIIEDHINFLPDNPLRGITEPALGNRFADMCCPYDKGLRKMLVRAFENFNIPVKEGVYAAVQGPSLETRAEYRWLKNAGADMVGMSTVPEVIVAVQTGLPCAAVTVITDECDPDNLKPVNIPEIIEVAGMADKTLSLLFADIIRQLA